MRYVAGLLVALGRVIRTEFENLVYGVAAALLPAFLLSRLTLPIPWFPTWTFVEWLKMQFAVYLAFRIWFVQRGAAR